MQYPPLHELAHALVYVDRRDDDAALSYAQGERIAESVAYSCCRSVGRSVGLATDENSIPYLASWAEQAQLDVLEHAAKLTDRLASRIETALHDTPAVEDGAGEREAVTA